ncbi:uncharacterized protein LOC117131947 [Brassica rapa]|uniref:uncharacterized protein LOC117131947 n=1 Tax=Brassica campestris TaxID=3711 RepID=UPI00142DA056|nr:uncharacterized protein LOC117131947 [Brassica rapa]
MESTWLLSSVTLAGIWNGHDGAKLLQQNSDLQVRSLIDLRNGVGEDDDGVALCNLSSTEIFSSCLEFNFLSDAAITKSDWGCRNLSLNQVRQASVEAAACFQLALQI